MMRRFLFSLLLVLGSVAVGRAERDLYNPLAVGLRWDVDVEVNKPGVPKVQGTVVARSSARRRSNSILISSWKRPSPACRK